MGLNLTEDQLRNILGKWWYAEDHENRTLDGLAKMLIKKGESMKKIKIGKKTMYALLVMFFVVAFVSFFTPLVKFFDMVTRLILIGLLVDNIFRTLKK